MNHGSIRRSLIQSAKKKPVFNKCDRTQRKKRIERKINIPWAEAQSSIFDLFAADIEPYMARFKYEVYGEHCVRWRPFITFDNSIENDSAANCYLPDYPECEL